MERKTAISILKKLKLDAEEYGKESDFVKQAVEAFDTAISSLETDEAYQLEYERPTKNDLAVEKTDMIDKSNFSQEQYKTDLQSAYDCGYAQAKNDLGVDCISRAQALKELKESADHHVNDSREEALLRRDRDIIRALPSVTPQEPRKGHWISHREHCENLGAMPSGLGAYEWCSNCDCGIDVREWHRNHYNYCPNCGADMKEVGDANID